MREITLQSTPLQEDIKYNYCPYCLQQTLKNGLMQKDAPKLIYKKILIVYDDKKANGCNREAIDEYWQCPRCAKSLTVEDIRVCYSVRADGTKWTSTPSNQGVNNGHLITG